jgi:hypothetical protein
MASGILIVKTEKNYQKIINQPTAFVFLIMMFSEILNEVKEISKLLVVLMLKILFGP